jgi:hypothetical protein
MRHAPHPPQPQTFSVIDFAIGAMVYQVQMKTFFGLLLLASFACAQSPAVEPSTIISSGAGVEGLGPSQVFGYASVSQHVAAKTYTTQIYEVVRMPGGTVGTSARAGLTTVLYELGRVWIGLVGDVGVAEGTTGSASGAFSGSGFVHCRCFGSWPMGFVATAQTMKIAGRGDVARVRIGFTWSF